MAFLQFTKSKKLVTDNEPLILAKKEEPLVENLGPAAGRHTAAGPDPNPNPNPVACVVISAPFIKGMLGGDIGLYVSDLHNYLYVKPGKVRLALETGDPIKDGSIGRRTVTSGARTVAKVGREVYGLPYIGTGYPIIDPVSQKVVGSIVTTTPVEQQEGLNELAGHMESQVNSISMAVTNLSATSQELTATMENLSSNAQGIREEINKTDNIVTMIREVSEQTHMLGLNAAIEAARVGDAGRGFNVVAEEIRKLSQDTNRSVKDILQILGEMKNSIVELTNFIDQVTEATQQQAVASQEINSSINELSLVSVELKKQADELIS